MARVAVTCENLRHCLLLFMGHKSFGISKKNVSIRSVDVLHT